MSCNTNTYPDDIYAYISVVLTSGPLQPVRMSYIHYTYKHIHPHYKQSIIKQISKLTHNTCKIFMHF